MNECCGGNFFVKKSPPPPFKKLWKEWSWVISFLKFFVPPFFKKEGEVKGEQPLCGHSFCKAFSRACFRREKADVTVEALVVSSFSSRCPCEKWGRGNTLPQLTGELLKTENWKLKTQCSMLNAQNSMLNFFPLEKRSPTMYNKITEKTDWRLIWKK